MIEGKKDSNSSGGEMDRQPQIKETETIYERSDTCAVPRAVPIFEGVLSLDLLNSLIEKTGGDSKDEIAKRVDNLQNYNIEDFELSNKKWTMGYENEQK